jgi:ABC-type polysaccharide/polyol phosphate transport system ATPase subunit
MAQAGPGEKVPQPSAAPLFCSRMTGDGVAVEVQDLHKSFRVPDHGPQGLSERLLHPVRRARPHELAVLDGVSFEVAKGEFFGIVGPNGSGKSTLMRLLAGIYEPDRGRVEVHGSVGPFIEIGVGFNPELTARQNVVLNGVMLGLTPSEVRARLDEILSFAEVEEFADLQLKNFSSGMRVRLAFGVMVQADPAVYLIDEVLAVGDTAFREKCLEEFGELRARGKTILLVSQQPATLEKHCDRALLLAGGKIEELGEPSEVARRYLEMSLESRGLGGRRVGLKGRRAPHDRVRIAELWIGDESGAQTAALDEEEPIELHVVADVEKRIRSAGLRFELRNERGARIFTPSDAESLDGADFKAGERVHARATIENRLPPGRYRVICTVVHNGPRGTVAVCPAQTVPFEVSGPDRRGAGLVSLEHTISVEPEDARELRA